MEMEEAMEIEELWKWKSYEDGRAMETEELRGWDEKLWRRQEKL